MSDESIIVLRQLATRFRRKLSRCKIYDPNVCTYRAIPERPWELIPIAGEPFSHRLQYVYRQRRVMLLGNKIYVNCSVRGIFSIGILTVNVQEKTGRRLEYVTTLGVNGKEYPVFADDTKLTADQKTLLKRPELFALIKDSDLQESESLHLTNGDASLYLKHPTLSRVTKSIDRIIDLAEQIETTEEESDLKLLPVQFHHFIPLIKKWAVGDDLEREDLLALSPKRELQALVDEVEPHLTAIDSYLDSFGDQPPSEEAAALGRLAECTAEAKLHLNTTKRSPTRN